MTEEIDASDQSSPEPGQLSSPENASAENDEDQSNISEDRRPTIDEAKFDRVTPFIIQLGAAAHGYMNR